MKKLSSQTKTTMLLIAFAILLFTAMQNIGLIFLGIRKVYSFFSPVVIGLCMAFILNVLLSALEAKPFAFMARSKRKFVRKLKRPLCMVLTYLIALGVITVMILVIIPELYDTILYIGERLPGFAKEARTWLEALLVSFDISPDIIPDFDINWTSVVNSVKDLLMKNYNNIFGNAVNITTSVVGSIANIVFGIMISGYVLAQKERIGGFVKRCINSFIPQRAAAYIYHIAECTRVSFSRFVGGQLTEAVILGVLCFVGMTILRIPNAAVISILICVTALVPVIGATIGVVVGALLILITNPIKALIFVAFFLILQPLEGTLIYPRVVGKSVGLPGIIVICAVLVGGNISGVVGALVSVPVCAVLYTLLKEAIEYRNPPVQQETEKE